MNPILPSTILPDAADTRLVIILSASFGSCCMRLRNLLVQDCDSYLGPLTHTSASRAYDETISFRFTFPVDAGCAFTCTPLSAASSDKIHTGLFIIVRNVQSSCGFPWEVFYSQTCAISDSGCICLDDFHRVWRCKTMASKICSWSAFGDQIA